MKRLQLLFFILIVLSGCKKKKEDTPEPPASTSTLQNGLVTYFTFSGNANGTGFNGTVSNATLVPDRFGNANSAYDFNGSTSFLDYGNVMNDVFAGNGKKFSFSVWIKPDAVMSNGIIIGKSADGGCSEDQRQFYFRILNNKVNFSYSPGSIGIGYGRYISGNTDITNLSKWYHIVMMYDGSVNTNDGLDRVKIYVDNVQETLALGAPSTGTLGDIQVGAAHLGIGNYLTTTGAYCQTITGFNGKIDDVRIYNRALTTSEIAEIYNATN
ncbi:MAG: LamG domain-containing protein [Cytophagaceae bacterium]|nr:LamG domain-containing protein [Cytophagaceae bacterium]